jgi:hypothetical protein
MLSVITGKMLGQYILLIQPYRLNFGWVHLVLQKQKKKKKKIQVVIENPLQTSNYSNMKDNLKSENLCYSNTVVISDQSNKAS